MFFDPAWLIFVGPAILLGLWAQFRVKSAFDQGSRYGNRAGLTGAQAARLILDRAGLRAIGVEPAQGYLSDHYDPAHRVLRLSPEVYHSNSLAAMGIAAHEAGHALQQARGYWPLKLRNGIVPLGALGSQLSMLLILGGVFGMFFLGKLGVLAIWAGILLYGAFVALQLVNLPVEYDASRRARELLVGHGIVAREELAPVSSVLNAAALTYVAATLSAVMTLLYLLFRFGGVGQSDD